MCAPDTGRPCRELSKRLQAVVRLADLVIENSPSTNRPKTVNRIKRELSTIRAELVPERGARSGLPPLR